MNNKINDFNERMSLIEDINANLRSIIYSRRKTVKKKVFVCAVNELLNSRDNFTNEQLKAVNEVVYAFAYVIKYDIND